MKKPKRIIGGLLAASLLSFCVSSQAAIITNQVGTPMPTGSDGFDSVLMAPALSDGWVEHNQNWSWTHTYTEILDTIVSATLTIDLIDADNGNMGLYAGSGNNGVLFGNATGDDNCPGCGRGQWQDIAANGGASVDTIVNISSSLFADLADGTFDVFGHNNGLTAWGSNRALLTIETRPNAPTAVPNAPVVWLFGAGILMLMSRRKKQ